MSKQLIKPEARPIAEAKTMARAMARARNSMIEFYDRHELHDRGASIRKVISHENDEAYITALRNGDPEMISWFGLDMIANKLGEEVACDVWDEIKREAIYEFDSGTRAANLIDEHASPSQRARFIVLRNAFRQDWQPRGGTELALVDQLAQAHYMWEKWLATHIMRIDMECWRDPKDDARADHKWIRPRQNEVEATREAADMADRWQKTFLRTLRALRDLRRYASSVVIQNAGQVTVANQQLNIVTDE